MISSRRFKVLQSEAFGVDANKAGQLEQVELLQALVRNSNPSVNQAWMHLYLAVTRLRDGMTANRDIQDICQAIIRLLFLAVSVDAIFNMIEPVFIVPRV